MPHPELIFVSGPQAGERAALSKRVFVAGRAPTCDLHLVEEFASRQQFRLEISPDGWVAENLSSRGTLVNGKKFKGSKRVILDTGDVLSVGTLTNILFVAAGDDPEAALEKYRQQHPEGELPPPAAQSPAAAAATPPPVAPPIIADAAQPPLQAAEDAAEAAAAAARKTKLKKYGMYAAIYVAVLVALILFLNSVSKTNETASGPPAEMEDREIDEALREPIKRGANNNIAAEARQKALSLYEDRQFHKGDLQRCAKLFKISLANQAGNKLEFDDFRMNEMYRNTMADLIRDVTAKYRRATIQERGSQWANAVRAWEELRVILPQDPEWDTPGYDRLTRNIAAHNTHCRQRLRK